MDAVVGVCYASRKQRLCTLLDQLFGLHIEVVALYVVVLGIWSLERELGNIGQALPIVVGGEVSSRSRHHLTIDLHLGLQKRRLVEQIVARAVVARNLDSNGILAPMQIWLKVVSINAIEVVRSNARTVSHKLAIDTQTVVARCREAYRGLARSTNIQGFAKGERQIALLLAAFAPYRLGHIERRWLVLHLGNTTNGGQHC